MNVKSICDSMHRLSDPELVSVWTSATNELARREEARKRRREEWIRDYHFAFQRHPNATYKVLGETVVVSVYDRCSGIHIGTTTPSGKDKFELSTGIAVAFAKAVGERIPEFI